MSNLKITDIRLFWCGDYPFIKLYTNEGITGIGENIVHHRGILSGQIEYLRNIIIGEDPFQIERIWMKMYSSIRQAHAMPMISGVDMALWDIKAKKLDVPAYELLGGLLRDKIRIYPHLKGTWNSFPDAKLNNLRSEPWGEIEYSLEQLKEHARELLKEGYTAIKFDPFKPGIDGYHSYRPCEIDAAVQRVAAIREAVGDDVSLMVECHGKFNSATAIKIGKRLEPYNLMWFEDPIPAGFAKSLKKVADQVNIPIAFGERLNSKLELKEYLELGVGDVMMFDIGKIGGITEAKKICALCETYQIKVAPHNPFGPVAAIASAHLSCAVFPFVIQEHLEIAPWAITPQIKIVNGYIELQSLPGFGVDLNEEEIAKFQKMIDDKNYEIPPRDTLRDRQIFSPAF